MWNFQFKPKTEWQICGTRTKDKEIIGECATPSSNGSGSSNDVDVSDASQMATATTSEAFPPSDRIPNLSFPIVKF